MILVNKYISYFSGLRGTGSMEEQILIVPETESLESFEHPYPESPRERLCPSVAKLCV